MENPPYASVLRAGEEKVVEESKGPVGDGRAISWKNTLPFSLEKSQRARKSSSSSSWSRFTLRKRLAYKISKGGQNRVVRESSNKGLRRWDHDSNDIARLKKELQKTIVHVLDVGRFSEDAPSQESPRRIKERVLKH